MARTPSIDDLARLSRDEWQDLAMGICGSVFDAHRVEDRFGKGNGLDAWRQEGPLVDGWQFRRFNDRLGPDQIAELRADLVRAEARARSEHFGRLRSFTVVFNLDPEPGHGGKKGEIQRLEELRAWAMDAHGIAFAFLGVSWVRTGLLERAHLRPDLFEDIAADVNAGRREAERGFAELKALLESNASAEAPRPKGRAVARPANPVLGREAELASLRACLDSGRTITVEGVAGIGKTSLLQEALVAYPPGVVLWIDIEGASSLGSIEALMLGRLAEMFGGTPDGIARSLCDADVVVVMDGLEKAEHIWDDVIDFVHRLIRETNKPKFVLGTQVDILGVPIDHRIVLGPLSHTASVEVLLGLAMNGGPGSVASDPSLAWIVRFCEGHPLSLTLAAALLRFYRRPAEVIARLEAGGARALAQPFRRKHTRSTSLEVCLTTTLDCLDVDERAVLSCIAHFPGGCVLKFLPAYSVPADPLRALAGLMLWHLVFEFEGVDALLRCRALAPIASFVREADAASDPAAFSKTSLDFVSGMAIQAAVIKDRYMRGDPASTAQGMARFDAELLNIEHARARAIELVGNGGQDDQHLLVAIATLASSLAEYYFVRRRFDAGEASVRAGIRAHERLGSEESASHLYMHLCSIAVQQGRPDVADRVTLEVSQWAERCGTPWALFVARAARGMSASLARDYALVVDTLSEALRGLPPGRTSETDKSTVALVESTLGDAYRRLGDLDRAMPLLSRGFSQNGEAGWSFGAGCSAHELANGLADQGESAAAVEHYLLAANIFLELGSAEYLSNAVSELGILLAEAPEQVAGLAERVSDDLLVGALSDAGEVLDREFKAIEGGSGLPESTLRVLRKFFGVCIAVTAAGREAPLSGWADEVRDRLLEVIGTFATDPMRVRELTPLFFPLDVGTQMAIFAGFKAVRGQLGADGGDPAAGLLDGVVQLESAGLHFLRAREWLLIWLGADGEEDSPQG